MPPSVFISYSHKDEVWKDRLVTHLGVLQHQGLLRTWSDEKIRGGDDWFEEIRKAMDEARLAVFLISANSAPVSPREAPPPSSASAAWAVSARPLSR